MYNTGVLLQSVSIRVKQLQVEKRSSRQSASITSEYIHRLVCTHHSSASQVPYCCQWTGLLGMYSE